jgi:hypothetical protein
MLSLRSLPRTVRRRTPLTEAEYARVLDELNAAVRFPDAYGGLACLPVLLDALAQGEDRPDGARWIVDDNARLDVGSVATLLFP